MEEDRRGEPEDPRGGEKTSDGGEYIPEGGGEYTPQGGGDPYAPAGGGDYMPAGGNEYMPAGGSEYMPAGGSETYVPEGDSTERPNTAPTLTPSKRPTMQPGASRFTPTIYQQPTSSPPVTFVTGNVWLVGATRTSFLVVSNKISFFKVSFSYAPYYLYILRRNKSWLHRKRTIAVVAPLLCVFPLCQAQFARLCH